MESVSSFPNTDELLQRNAAYAEGGHKSDLPGEPSRHLTVVACMDARIDPYAVLGIENGEVHMLRNAGGVITDDVIRSLCLSQRYLGTREIVLIHHTDCGLAKVREDELRAELAAETGEAPEWDLQGFDDPHDDVRLSIKKLQESPFVPHKSDIRGFVFDVAGGTLDEVTVD